MNAIRHLKVEPIEGRPMNAHIYLDGEEVHSVSGVELRMSANEIPTATLEINSNFEFDGEANIKIVESDDSLEDALAIIRRDLLHEGDLYNGFKASIVSALNEAKNYESNERLADRILDRIIGEE